MSETWILQPMPSMNPPAPRTPISPLDVLVYAPPASDHLSFLPFPATLGYIILALEKLYPVPSLPNWIPQVPAPPQPPRPPRYMSFCSMLGQRDDLLRWVAGQQHQTAVSRFALDQSARLEALTQQPITNDNLIAWIENELAVRCEVSNFVSLFAEACLTRDDTLVLLTVYAGLTRASTGERHHWIGAFFPCGLLNPNMALHYMAQAEVHIRAIFESLRRRMGPSRAQSIIDKVVPQEAIQRNATLLQQATQSAHAIQVVQTAKAAQFMQPPQNAQANPASQNLQAPRAVRPIPSSLSNHGARSAQHFPAASARRTTSTASLTNATQVNRPNISHASAAATSERRQAPSAPHGPNTLGVTPNFDPNSARQAAEASQTVQRSQAE